MTNRRVLAVVGTRPEAVKMAPLVMALRRRGGFEVRVVGTGQHGELLDQTWAAFGLGFDRRLALMQPAQTLAQTTARLLASLDEVMAEEHPDIVIGQGDTMSCLAAAMAAFYRRLPFAHLEAGLRSGAIDSPFPEEAQRQLIDRLSSWHFAPTAAAMAVLRQELPDAAELHLVGNTVIDALRWTLARQPPSPWPASSARHRLLVTMHRRESFGQPLADVCAALRRIAAREDVQLLLPVHPNPAVQQQVHGALAGLARLQCCPPLPYPAMVAALRDSTLLLTDSGGLQEEAPALGLPVLVLRERTERPEGVAAGTARLVGTGTEAIVAAVDGLLDHPAALQAMRRVHEPYGMGDSGERIAEILARFAQVKR